MQCDLVIAKLFHDQIPKQYGTLPVAFPAYTHLLSNDVAMFQGHQSCGSCKEYLMDIYFTDRSKAVLLFWIFNVFVLSCVCYVFVRVC